MKTIKINNIAFSLLPEKALHIPAFHALCIADWHLGKAAHFRKAGIPMPQPDLALEFSKVAALISTYAIEKVILLGDVFHSEINNDWLLFEEFIRAHAAVEWILTLGNHDIIAVEKFQALGIQAASEYPLGGQILCVHADSGNAERKEENHPLIIAGHVHPGCEIVAGARQKFRLPCFHYSRSVLTLPAFGGLTGLYILHPDKENRIFPILGDEVRELKL